MRNAMPRILAVPAAVSLGLALFAVSLTWQVPKAAAASLDSQSSEIVRLINGARAAAGKAPLAVDVFLASVARDGAIPCPDDAAKTIAGRTKDFATFGATSHSLRLCDSATYAVSSTTFVSTMQTAWGYGSVGEIIGLNGGYGNGAYLYTYKTWQTWTYATTGHMMAGWQSSSTHWNIIIGGYDRVGCGGWSSGSTYFYDCAFARGGPSPSGLRGAVTKSPFSNPLPAPVVTPPPAPKAPARTAAPRAGTTVAGASATPEPTATPTPTPTPTPTATLPPIEIARLSHVDATATATTTPAAAVLHYAAIMPPPTPLPATVARTVALVAGIGAGLLSVLLALLSRRRRRRDISG